MKLALYCNEEWCPVVGFQEGEFLVVTRTGEAVAPRPLVLRQVSKKEHDELLERFSIQTQAS
ncbi:hypothetical protein ACFYKX_11545 [Cytobacillus sp. FJAT-54145]|uniref:Uncharacterized protein n=1 Tax=Cytobacillus spartinae TaxID=3299023 RepID=A0ABW6KAI8_9BACI